MNPLFLFVFVAVADVAALFVLWLLFVVVMSMERARDAGRLAPSMIRVGKGIVAFGLVWDILCNILIASRWFLELPQEATVSERLRRLVAGDQGKWRTRLARWFATTLMNPFCPPDSPHIKIPQ